jgi:hypothetical protein
MGSAIRRYAAAIKHHASTKEKECDGDCEEEVVQGTPLGLRELDFRSLSPLLESVEKM